MNTTAVQQLQQLVEIQGAPVVAKTKGDDFGVTFAANVKDSAGGKIDRTGTVARGISVSKQTTNVSLKEAEMTPFTKKNQSLHGGTIEGVPSLKDTARSDREFGSETPSLLKAGSLVSAKDPKSSNAKDDSRTETDSRSAVVTGQEDESRVSVEFLNRAKLSAPKVPQGLSERTVGGAQLQAAAEPVTKGRKDADPVSNKLATCGVSQDVGQNAFVTSNVSDPVAAPTVLLSQPNPGVTSQSQQDQPAGSSSLPQAGAKGGVLANVPQGSDAQPSISLGREQGNSFPIGKTNEVLSSLPNPEEASVPGRVDKETSQAEAASSAVEGAGIVSPQLESAGKAVKSEAEASAASERDTAGGGTGSVLPTHLQDALSRARHLSEPSSARAGKALQPSSTISGPTSNDGSDLKARSVAESQSVAPGTLSTSEPPDASFSKGLAVAGDVKGASAHERHDASTQPGAAAKPMSSDSIDDSSRRTPTAAGSTSMDNLTSGSKLEVPASDESLFLRGTHQLPGTVSRSSKIPALGSFGGAERRVAPSKPGAAVGGPEKPKASPDADDRAPALRAEAGQTSFADTAIGPANNLSVSAANTTARGAADVVTIPPVVQVVSHTTVPVIQTGGNGTSATATVHALGTLGEGSLSEASSLGAQMNDSHRTLVATPTTLEVGVQSGTQGWLRIRAEVGEQGAVNASLTAGSSGGREMLHSQMPALNAFLHSEQLSVTTTVVDHGLLSGVAHASPGSGSGGLGSQDASSGSNGSMLQGGGTQGGGGQRETTRQASGASASETMTSFDSRGGVSEAGGQAPIGTTLSNESGRWLNVRV